MLQYIDTTTVNGAMIGDPAPTGSAKLNGNTKEILTRIAGPLPTTKVGVIADGDSKFDEPRVALRHLAFKHNLDIDFSAPGQGVGGSFLADVVGNASRLASTRAAITAALANTPVLDYWLSSTTNDGSIGFDEVYAQLKIIHNTLLRPLGVRYFVLRATPPQLSTAHDPRSRRGKIAAMYQYARDNPYDCLFFDENNYMIDMASANGDPIGTAGGYAFPSVARDGTHYTNYGITRLADLPALVTLARSIYRPRLLPILGQNDGFTNDTNGKNGNLIGPRGRMIALGGGSTLTGATVTGSAPLGWNLAGHAEGLTLAFSTIAEVPFMLSQYGLPGIPGVRLRITGTNTSGAGTQPVIKFDAGFNNPTMPSEVTIGGNLLFAMTNTVGVTGVGAGGGNLSGLIGQNSFTQYGLNDQMAPQSGVFCVNLGTATLSGQYNFVPEMNVYIPVGGVVDATIDLLVYEQRKVNTSPKAG